MAFNINDHLQELIELRHQLHFLAEVSGQEEETAQAIQAFLQQTAPAILQTGVGGYGLMATYEGQSKGAHILIRCELDALPIPDRNEVEYQSKNKGVAHKCGHDGHMSIVCGLARYLGTKEMKSGQVTLLFQPAEETGQGARQILDHEKFQRLKLDYCFALHNIPGVTLHQIIVKEDTFAAASVGVRIHLEGKTAHSAHPEEGKSPALAVAQIIQAFSAIPQFYIALEKGAKVTINSAKLGEQAFGISPGFATVMATLRSYDDEIMDILKSRCLQIAKSIATTYGLDMDVEWVEPFPATINNAEAVQWIQSAAEQLNYKIDRKPTPFSWSEDFGHFTSTIKGAMFGLGSGKAHPPLHAEDYDFPDALISTGVAMFTKIIQQINST